jgi:hypothetical protein
MPSTYLVAAFPDEGGEAALRSGRVGTHAVKVEHSLDIESTAEEVPLASAVMPTGSAAGLTGGHRRRKKLKLDDAFC